MILIGSHALNSRIKLNRPFGQDIDVMCSYDQFDCWVKSQKPLQECYPIDQGKKMIVRVRNTIYEFELAWENSTAASFAKYVYNDVDTIYQTFDTLGTVAIPSLNALYALKMSHRYLRNSPHFSKTMRDCQTMANEGATIPDELKSWYKERQKVTYDYKHPNLKQNKDGFFNLNEGVNYVYDHDTIHIAMAHLEKPAYEYYKGDNAEVFCSKEDFFKADESVRLFGVLEEAYVLAIERSQVPFKGKVTPKRSFDIALEKVCSSITSGWFREYAWNNYDKIQSMYDERYVDKFWKAVDTGVVKKLKE